MIHHPLSPGVVRPQISSSLRLLVICFVCPACSSYITICLFKKKKTISSIGSLDKCHTSVSNALVSFVFSQTRFTTMTLGIPTAVNMYFFFGSFIVYVYFALFLKALLSMPIWVLRVVDISVNVPYNAMLALEAYMEKTQYQRRSNNI